MASSTTPRKKRGHQSNSLPHGHGHQRTRSQQLAAQSSAAAYQISSDYESDTTSYMAAHPAVPPAALAQRSNTELNMAVLKRYLPDISDIRSVAANAVVYTLDPETVTWDKANVEGTMFVCKQGKQEARGCIFVLNRKGLDNLIVNLAHVQHIEVKDNLLILAMENKDGDEATSKVLGLFIHADMESTRATNTDLIQALWTEVREAPASQQEPTGDLGPAMQAMGGRQVSLNELFGR
jgi:hypothetical protein